MNRKTFREAIKLKSSAEKLASKNSQQQDIVAKVGCLPIDSNLHHFWLLAVVLLRMRVT